ncbi:hypothetical protein D6789_02085 [Candidatus Woesearchaeota archaeon]|nr:MAG: hypothetical protein D6789_02085 [Candidatus Woesearchaeota archaeon]
MHTTIRVGERLLELRKLDLVPGALRPVLRDAAKEVFTHSRLALVHAHVIIEIRDDIPNPRVEERSLKKHRAHILLPSSLFAADEQHLSQQLRNSLNHEFAHLWHNDISPSLKRALESARRLKKGLEKEKLRFLQAYRQSTMSPERAMHLLDKRSIRSLLHRFFIECHIEGIAEYCENTLRGLDLFKSDVHAVLRAEARETAMTANLALANAITFGEIDVRVFKRVYDKAPYVIGHHMVFTLLLKEYTLEEVVKMNYHEFVKAYERVCKHIGERPLVSLTSGKGILDYKEMLKRWRSAFSQKS